MATFSPAQPWCAKTRLAPARPQGATKDDPSNLACLRYLWDGPDESPTARVQRGPFRPRVARAQGTHRAIPSPAGGHFQHPARSVGWNL